jgi:hypothetical protein
VPEPRAAEDRWAGKGRTVVINPFLTLCDEVKVTLADVPQLLPHLRQDWLLVAVGRRPDKVPGGGAPTLNVSTRPLMAALVNDLARKEILHVYEDGRYAVQPSEREVQRRIDAFARWAREHEKDSAADLEWLWVRHDARGEDGRQEGWEAVAPRIDFLLRAGDRRVLAPLRATLRDPRAEGDDRAWVLKRLVQHDPAEARRAAPYLLAEKDDRLRVRAALLCLHGAAGGPAREALGDYLRRAGAEGVPPWDVQEVIRELLADGDPESRRAAARAFEGAALRRMRSDDRARLLREMAAEGFEEQACSFYLPLLRVKEDKLDGVHYHGPVCEEIAREVSGFFAPNDPAVRAIVRRHPGLADRVAPVEEWLRERLAAAAERRARQNKE